MSGASLTDSLPTTSLSVYLLSLSLTEYLLACVGTCLGVWFMQYIQTVIDIRRRYPPGPILWPIFYSKLLYPLYYKSWSRRLHEWRKYYGDLITVCRNQPVVYLHGYDVIKEAFVDNADALSDRPREAGTHFGITFGYSPVWKHLRKHFVNFLMEPANKGAGLEKKIHDEISHILVECEKSIDQKFDLTEILHGAAANITCYTLFGQRFDYDAEESYINKGSNPDRFLVLHRILDTFPIIKLFPWLMPGLAKVSTGRKVIRLFAKIEFDKHLESLDSSHPRDYIDAMLIHRAESADDAIDKDSFSEDHIRESISSLFIGGADTSGTALRWAILFSTLYPEMQEKIYKEIDDHIGVKLPTLLDYQKMPFTQAFLTESMRMRPSAAETLAHVAIRDVSVKGQTIPKGAVVHANLFSVTHDESLFGPDVYNFNPGRFLDENEEYVKPNHFIVFGLGRRKCPGASVGSAIVPLFFIAVLQQYKITLPEGQDINLHGEQYSVLTTSHYKVVLQRREVQ